MEKCRRGTLLAGCLLLLCAAGNTQETPRPPRRLALLVGCTTYPHLDTRLHLRGPANDVALLQSALQRYLDVPVENTTSLVGWDEERPETRPTRANILAHLRRLADPDVSGPGAQVIVLLAGHGARQPDRDGDELDGLDEVFLPADVRDWKEEVQTVENAITDDELGVAIGAIRDTGARVWLLVDSCFSGTMLRGADSEVHERFVPSSALHVPVRKGANPTADAGDRGSVGLRDTRDIVAMYASRSHHVAGEKRLPPGAEDREWHGVLSFLVARELANSGPATTFGDLYHRVVTAYPGVWRGTLPLAEGDLAQLVRGGDAKPGPLLQVRNDGARLVVDGGTLHGLCPEAVLAVYRPGQRGIAGARLGHLRLTRVQLTRSFAEAVGFEGSSLPPLDGALSLCPVEVVQTPVSTRRLRVAFRDDQERPLVTLPEDVQRWFEDGSRLQSAPASDADLRVTLAGDRAVIDVLAAGNRRSYRLPRQDLGRTLLQIHRADNLSHLAIAASGSSDDLGGVEVALAVAGRDLQPGDTLRPGTPVELRVRNASRQEREVWVFLIDADYGVQEVFPAGRPALLAPDEDRAQTLEFTASDVTLGPERLLTLVVPPGSGSLAWMAQPPLRTRAGTGVGLSGVLEGLMFGTRGVTARLTRGGDVRVGVLNWETTWGTASLPDWPSTPVSLPAPQARSTTGVPDPWRLGDHVAALRDATGRIDALLLGGDRPGVLLIDLDGNASVASDDAAALRDVVAGRAFEAEMALVVGGAQRLAFYDTDDDGRFDLALADDDDDPLADREFVLRGEDWDDGTAVGRPWLRIANLERLLANPPDRDFENRALARVSALLR